jgi:phage-related protein
METQSNIIRDVLKTDEYNSYFNSLDIKIQARYDYAIQIMQTQKVVSEKFVKKIQKTEFYEVRVSIGTNEYRTMLIAIDNLNFMEAKRVILLNSFLKKDSKQYNREIKKARAIVEKEEIICNSTKKN